MRCTFWLLLFLYSISGLAQHKGTGLIFDDESYMRVPKKPRLMRGDYSGLPKTFSLKQYAPKPGNQMQLNNSVAWASAYSAKTIIHAYHNRLEDRKEITRKSFAPSFTYAMIKATDDENCTGGAKLNNALESLKTHGAIRYMDFQYFCTGEVSEKDKIKARENRITDYSRLYDDTDSDPYKLRAIKKAIFGKYPVVIGMHTPPSFNYAKEFWQPRESFSEDFPGQALCVVGYDDTKYGGAFEVMNSWGSDWGNEGFMWIPYDAFLEFVKYAYEVYEAKDLEGTPDLAGEVIINLDEGGTMQAQLVDRNGIYKINKPYPTGTLLQIVIENKQTAYAYVIGTDLSYMFGPLFPPPDSNLSPLLSYPSNHLAIPDPETFIQMQDPPGRDFLCIIYSKEELIVEDLVNKLNNASGNVMNRIKSVLGHSIVDYSNFKFDQSRISFSGFSKGKTILPLIIEIDHI